VKKTEAGETILYVNKYFEKNLTTGENTTYYYLGGKLVAKRTGTTLNYLHQDHLTGTAVVSSDNGTLIASTSYYPFGERLKSEGNLGTDKLFTGQRLDGTGLYYYGARYYDPQIGRFISADTIVPDRYNPQSLNRYSYVNNNPLKYNDPSGHFPFVIALVAMPLWQWAAATFFVTFGVVWWNVKDDIIDSLDINISFSKSNSPEDIEREKNKQERHDETSRRIKDAEENPENMLPTEEERNDPYVTKGNRRSTRQEYINDETGDILEKHRLYPDDPDLPIDEHWKMPDDEDWPQPTSTEPAPPIVEESSNWWYWYDWLDE